MVQSRTELYGVVQSRREIYGIVQRRTELYGLVSSTELNINIRLVHNRYGVSVVQKYTE